MEFNEKLQRLRKQKGLTQEELAQALFVSRTAISKWESGRGYPSIDSLKEISQYFGVTIDRLLSGEELLVAVQTDNQNKKKILCNHVFAALDISTLMFLFIPFFRQQTGDMVQAVSVLFITGISIYMKILYLSVIILLTICGITTFILNKAENSFIDKYGNRFSYILNIVAVLIFIVGLQPYPAVLMFVYLRIKAILLMKKQ